MKRPKVIVDAHPGYARRFWRYPPGSWTDHTRWWWRFREADEFDNSTFGVRLPDGSVLWMVTNVFLRRTTEQQRSVRVYDVVLNACSGRRYVVGGVAGRRGNERVFLVDPTGELRPYWAPLAAYWPEEHA